MTRDLTHQLKKRLLFYVTVESLVEILAKLNHG